MGFLKLTLLLDDAVFVVFTILLELGDLVFNLSDSSLQGGLLEGLGLLVIVDLLFGNKVVEGFSRVLCDDGINLCGSILYGAAPSS